ncbi:pyridoxamine 5'-phosphate oxidase family protein [Kitasatospora kifunensis]|uniref:Pyridoxamine 5'-phosphate oxidase N-terminal domain-containing protein n=1 Tax=Kitasatospora kifunensis TaxID=58351 RepID=A0A7W7VYU1_KITKI|nr:pyridoxamine 5'-phosphate oxidase family protein [Kitasatospora kifunensis]MBB4927403.1 hypothetical protein [Kitasatospora kifunensis]
MSAEPPTRAVYHEGERAVQRAAGLTQEADRVADIMGGRLSLTAQAFLSIAPCLALGAADGAGRLWASILYGPAGMVRASPGSLRIAAAPAAGDPIGPRAPGDHLGLLAMDFARRRRLRINGRVRVWEPRSIELAVDRAYGNCPRYIQRRELDTAALADRGSGPAGSVHPELTEEQRELIMRSDTLFIASSHPGAGADVSHRGGPPGFLRVVGPRRVQLPDYEGNAMFNTLGNIWVNPRVGLALCDFRTGETVQITGRAAIDHSPPAGVWDGQDVRRVLDIAVEQVVWTPGVPS